MRRSVYSSLGCMFSWWGAWTVPWTWEFMPTGTTINSAHYCETMGKLKVWLQNISSHGVASPSTWQYSNTQVWEHVQRFITSTSLSLIIQLIVLTSCCSIFISFSHWRNILEDITTHLTMKSRQQLSCGSLIQSYSSIVIDYGTTWMLVNVCRLQRWLLETAV